MNFSVDLFYEIQSNRHMNTRYLFVVALAASGSVASAQVVSQAPAPRPAPAYHPAPPPSASSYHAAPTQTGSAGFGQTSHTAGTGSSGPLTTHSFEPSGSNTWGEGRFQEHQHSQSPQAPWTGAPGPWNSQGE